MEDSEKPVNGVQLLPDELRGQCGGSSFSLGLSALRESINDHSEAELDELMMENGIEIVIGFNSDRDVSIGTLLDEAYRLHGLVTDDGLARLVSMSLDEDVIIRGHMLSSVSGQAVVWSQNHPDRVLTERIMSGSWKLLLGTTALSNRFEPNVWFWDNPPETDLEVRSAIDEIIAECQSRQVGKTYQPKNVPRTQDSSVASHANRLRHRPRSSNK